MSDRPKCDCLECRIREACNFRDGEPVEVAPIVAALGNVLSECLAHFSSRDAKRLAADLLVARKKWLTEPRVAVQQEPKGKA
jgi:hypothetical protein